VDSKTLAVPVSGLELGAAVGAMLVVPGASATVPPLGIGAHKFQCLIHPWMRTVVEVR
jgi:hypothetical protein